MQETEKANEMYLPLRLLILLVLTAPVIALAQSQGGQDGGGGGVIFCHGSDKPSLVEKTINGQKYYFIQPPKPILSHGREFELLDLWEAETGIGPFLGHPLTIPFDNSVSKEEFFSRALTKLAMIDKPLAKIISEIHHQVFHTHMLLPIPDGWHVQPALDADEFVYPDSCQPRGLGQFSDRMEKLMYDKNMFLLASTIDQAAFEMHEALYKYFRLTRGFHSSWEVRRMVGMLFATEHFSSQQFLPSSSQP